MHYCGGKHYVSKSLVNVLNQNRKPWQLYIEPFVGALNIFHRMTTPRIGSDANKDLIEMYYAYISGWRPPNEISEERYYELKASVPNPERTFAGYACSFGGKFYRGYARSGKRNLALDAINSLDRKISSVNINELRFCGYTEYSDVKGALIYCDPPYRNAGKIWKFDSNEFWEWAEQMSAGNDVFVSEFDSPDNWECVWQKELNRSMRSKSEKKMTEKLFRLKK